jgi:hypothetical protein
MSVFAAGAMLAVVHTLPLTALLPAVSSVWLIAPGGAGAVTVIAALPLCPSLAAVIVAEPATCPVTSPPVLTVATLGLLLAHVTVRPVSGLPFASLGVAVSCTVAPATTLAVAGLTVTDATGVGHVTLTLAVSDLSPGWLVAATLKVPHDAVFQ